MLKLLGEGGGSCLSIINSAQLSYRAKLGLVRVDFKVKTTLDRVQKLTSLWYQFPVQLPPVTTNLWDTLKLPYILDLGGEGWGQDQPPPRGPTRSELPYILRHIPVLANPLLAMHRMHTSWFQEDTVYMH